MKANMKLLAVLASVGSTLVMVAYWGFLEPAFLTYPGLPWPAVADVHAGETVVLAVARCNSTDVEQSYVITHRLVRLDAPQDDVILPAGAVSIDPGCHASKSRANPIPADTPPGRYYVKGSAKVDGRWRTSFVPWSSRPFDVLPKEAP